MKREELLWSVQVAPTFAAYAKRTSGAEAMRMTAAALLSSGGDEDLAAEVLTHGSAGTPQALINSESEPKRIVGYGWSAVDAGNRQLGIVSMLLTLRLFMRGRLAALENKYVSFVNTTGTLGLIPLMVVIMWGTGFVQLEPALVTLAAAAASAPLFLMVYASMFRDVPFYKLYTFTVGSPAVEFLLSSLFLGGLASLPAAVLLYLTGGPPSAAFLLWGAVLWTHLKASGRDLWLRPEDAPAFLAGVAGAYKAGVPLNVEIQRLAAMYPSMRDLAYGVPRPSILYTAALALYKAMREAGAAEEAVEYLRDVIGELRRISGTVTATSLMLALVFAGASVAVSTVVHGTVVTLTEMAAQAGGALPVSPPDPQLFAATAAQTASLVSALQTAAAFINRSAAKALVAGGAVGTAVWAAIAVLT